MHTCTYMHQIISIHLYSHSYAAAATCTAHSSKTELVNTHMRACKKARHCKKEICNIWRHLQPTRGTAGAITRTCCCSAACFPQLYRDSRTDTRPSHPKRSTAPVCTGPSSTIARPALQNGLTYLTGNTRRNAIQCA